MTLPIVRIEWKPCWRIIPSRFPPIQLFERVTDPDDLEAIFELDALTNPRLRDEAGDIELVPPEDRISGPGTTVIMAAFTHLNPNGSRFSDGTYGVFYAANDLEHGHCRDQTPSRAVFERHGRGAYGTGHAGLPRRPRRGSCTTCAARKLPSRLSTTTTATPASQHLARMLRAAGSNGISYDSVRRTGGECVAVFRPPLLSDARQERHLCYVWNGQEVETVYEKREIGDDSRF